MDDFSTPQAPLCWVQLIGSEFCLRHSKSESIFLINSLRVNCLIHRPLAASRSLLLSRSITLIPSPMWPQPVENNCGPNSPSENQGKEVAGFSAFPPGDRRTQGHAGLGGLVCAHILAGHTELVFDGVPVLAPPVLGLTRGMFRNTSLLGMKTPVAGWSLH